ncbi:MAG: group II intron reverse transcriptase/maturase [Alphaproteobacteria bacterium]|nr:group II intron reverse transcriptase/maturase [Alphaproteobacteria bacterium]MDE2112747.1 group II intron reverse transcriptase/maturase [Alphaproteobacteria bacterium]MDE2495718.1 group II intron reverse transcriptase/maturase [Alphaproteobacteria bacterium]
MDTDHRADETWVLGVQRKLYQWSKANPDDQWRDMWGWFTDPRMLRSAWRRVSANKGGRTAGVDGMTVGRIRKRGEDRFLAGLQAELRSGAYRPSPARRKLIPKAGKPGQFRALGIPTIRDRVVQSAAKILLEPIFEAQFYHVSYGFRPGRSTHGALEHIRRAAQSHKRGNDTRRYRMSYPWVIEGDIKGCFDNINHHYLMERLRKRIADQRIIRLIGQFLKSGVLAEDQFFRTQVGTPQGGIISPLLANIALSAIEERYKRWVHPDPTGRVSRQPMLLAASARRRWDRQAGHCVYFPVRYADDFVVLVSGTQEDAIAEKSALAKYLRETLGLELSPEKTKISAMTDGFEFLGFRFVVQWDKRYGYCARVQIPKSKSRDLRRKVKECTGRSNARGTLGAKLQELNPILRGWANYFRFCFGASRVFTSLDWYTGDRLWRWQRKVRPNANASEIAKGRQRSSRRPTVRLWRDGPIEQYMLAWTPVCRFRLAWMGTPHFAMSSGEPDA